MRVFVTGASGAIGTRLLPQLLARGHEVTGTCHTRSSADRLRAAGADAVVVDLLDPAAVRAAVAAAKPDAIVHEATALAGVTDFKHFDRSFATTNRLRTEGTDALLAAARAAGVDRFVAQSFAGHRYVRKGGPIKTETDPLDPRPAPAMRQTVAATNHLDKAVMAAGGTALRYGNFYGPHDHTLVDAVCNGRFPIVDDGAGVWSFIHLDDAAAATVLALEHGCAGVYHIVDDEPAATRDWLPVLAAACGAKRPRRVSRRLARVFAGRAPVMMATQSRGASNAKAKAELSWALRYPSWRQGFAEAYQQPTH